MVEVGSAAARDKFDGEPPFCSCRATWRRRELADGLADEIELFQGQLARWGGSGGADTAGACCGRQLAATADLTVALCGARGGRGGSAVQEETGRAGCSWPRAKTGAGWAAARRSGSVHARAKHALWHA